MTRALYSLLTMLLAPAAFAITLLRGFRDRAYWAGAGERFGWGRRLEAPSLWLHAVSLGEVAASAELVRALRARHPRSPFVLTTATPTGRARAQSLFGDGVDVRYLPYDTPCAVRRFLGRIRPAVSIIMETELWPTLILECGRRGIPVVLASARLTSRSVSRYRRIGGPFLDALASVTLIAAQTSGDAERFAAIGADRKRIQVVGNVKFDLRIDRPSGGEAGALSRAAFGGRRVWIAGSTHEGEEEQVLHAHAALRRVIPDALLLLAPRHPQRFASVAALLKRLGTRFGRRSAADAVRAEDEVLLVDTVGELASLYAAADAAFVGGSLVPVGGHNLLEPAVLGVPVITGPHTANGREIARALVECGGAVVVSDAQSLAEAVRRFLQDPGAGEQAGRAGRSLVEANRGTVARLVELIDPVIRDPEPRPERAQAGPSADG